MKDTPTSGPISTSITHQVRDESSSRHSFSISQANGDLRERKEDLFKRRRTRRIRGARRRMLRELVDGALAADAPAAQEHEAVAHARGVGNLVDREEQRAALCRMIAQRGAD